MNSNNSPVYDEYSHEKISLSDHSTSINDHISLSDDNSSSTISNESISKYQNHSLSSELRLHCNLCNRKFHKKIHLIKHMNIHDQSRPLKCELCNKRFNLMWHLKRHQLIHSQIKPFNCNQCSKSFCTKCELQRHINYSHYGIKQFICEVCNRSFTLKSNLKVHMRKHTGEKPYQCNICHCSFYQSGHLTYHLKKHENNNTIHTNLPLKQSNHNISIKNDIISPSKLLKFNDYLPKNTNTITTNNYQIYSYYYSKNPIPLSSNIKSTLKTNLSSIYPSNLPYHNKIHLDYTNYKPAIIQKAIWRPF